MILSPEKKCELLRRSGQTGWMKSLFVAFFVLIAMICMQEGHVEASDETGENMYFEWSGLLSVPGTVDNPGYLNKKATTGAENENAHVLFLISEDPDNYEAHISIPRFARLLSREHNFETTVLLGEGELTAYQFPGLEEALAQADLLVIFFRRIALPTEQMDAIKNYLDSGKPLVGIRTANHAFSVRETDGRIPADYEDWWEFVADILGCENQGYGPAALGTRVNVVPEMADHPILEGQRMQWHSTGNVYHNELLDEEATVLITGSVEDAVEPIAWTRYAGDSRVFYTSLGHPADFGVSFYRRLLVNGIRWGLGRFD